MTDHFALFNEPRRPWLDADALKAKFLALSTEVHPDRVNHLGAQERRVATERYAALNAAHNCLREPRERLRHLLELELGRKPSDLTNVPDELLNLFFEVGAECRKADALLNEKAAASSPLLLVGFFERGQTISDVLMGLKGGITPRRDALIEELRALDSGWGAAQPKPLERLHAIWRLLGFYDRWLAQLQERIVQLSF